MKAQEHYKQYILSSLICVLLAIFWGCEESRTSGSKIPSSKGSSQKQQPVPSATIVPTMPIIEKSGWMALTSWTTIDYDPNGKIKSSSEPIKEFMLHSENGELHLLQFLKDTAFNLPSQDQNDLGVMFHFGENFKYKIKGYVSETSSISSIQVISIERLK